MVMVTTPPYEVHQVCIWPDSGYSFTQRELQGTKARKDGTNLLVTECSSIEDGNMEMENI